MASLAFRHSFTPVVRHCLDVARGEDCLAAIAGMKMGYAVYASWHFCERAT